MKFGSKELPRYSEVGMLDSDSKAIVEQALKEPSAKWWTQPIETSRQEYKAMIESCSLPNENLADLKIKTIPGPDNNALDLWCYTPKDKPDGLLPIVYFLRGSGMCMGEMMLYDTIFQAICSEAGAILVSVDYRLGPENKYPAGLRDAKHAYDWLASNGNSIGGDTELIAIGGDSAGGMLSAAICHELKTSKRMPIFQSLICPALKMPKCSRSAELFSSGYLLDIEDLQWLYDQYVVHRDDCDDPRVSPLNSSEFSNLPPTFMITAGFDVMRDDSERYLAMLKSSGVPVELHRYESTIHPFINMAGVIEVGRAAIYEIGAKFRAAFSEEIVNRKI